LRHQYLHADNDPAKTLKSHPRKSPMPLNKGLIYLSYIEFLQVINL
jgi:hypothetical protein